jgi:ABC-2 type transport system permease protein
MSSLTKLVWVELKLFVREPVTLVFSSILPLLILLVMGEIFGKYVDTDGMYRGVTAMDYYIPVYIGVVLAAVGTIAIPVHIANYRERGILRRFQASSLSVRSLFSAQLIVGVIITVASMILLIVAAVVFYHIRMPHNIGLIVLSSILAMFCFTAIGLFLGFILPSARAAQGVGVPLFFVMFMISGAGPPRAAMSAVMRDVGQALPLWHVTTLIQDAWLGFGWNTGASLILVGILILATAVTFRVFRKALI